MISNRIDHHVWRGLKITLFVYALLFSWGCADSQDERFQKLNQQGIDYYAQRRYPSALAAWHAANELKPEDGSVFLNIGAAYLKLADLPQAIDAYKHALKRLPDRPDVRNELIRLYILYGDFVNAEAQIQLAEAAAPDDLGTQILRGDLCLSKNQVSLAEASYKKAAAFAGASRTALMKLALCYLVQGKAEKARETYDIVAATSPIPPNVLLQMYHYWKFKDDPQQAEGMIQKALALEPENLSLQWELANFYFVESRYDAARSCVDKILKANPDNHYASMFLIEILMAQNQIQAAKGQLRELAGERGKQAGLALLEGKLHLLENTPLVAASFFKMAIEQDPDLVIAHYLLGIAYLADGRNHLAQISLQEALRRDPLFTDAELLLADLYYQQDQVDFGLVHARRIVEREVENYRAHLLLGHLLLASDQYDSAQRAYRAAGRLNPESFSALYYRAIAAEKTGSYPEALRLFKRVHEENPELVDVTLRYCRLLIHTGAVETATEVAQQAVLKNPDNGFFYHVRGEVELGAGNRTNAIEAFEKAVDLAPNLISAYNQLAQLAEKADDRPAQIKILTAGIENNPTYVAAYLQLAELHRKQWALEEATEILEKGLRENPGSAWLGNSLAWLYLERDEQLNKALELAQSAHEKLPDAIPIIDTLGWAYIKRGHYNRAVWILKEAASKAPANPMILFHLGQAQQGNGDMVSAEENLEKVLAMDLPNPYREKARQLLDTLRTTDQASGETQWQSPAPQLEDSMAAPPTATDDFEKIMEQMSRQDTDIGLEDLESQSWD